MTWDPTQYRRYASERDRPFHELVDRIKPPQSGAITDAVDLGCGPGTLTATLAKRWPTAQIVGIDSDVAMIEAAQSLASERVRFAPGSIADWAPAGRLDVIVANAAFQWVPQHRAHFARWLDMLNPGGTLAFQVPGNLDDPHHEAIRQLRSSPRWASAGRLAQLPERTHDSFPAATYLRDLHALGAAVDAWETTYLHVLQGTDPVLEWVKGTALRPVLAALDTDDQRKEFCADLAPMLRTAYPPDATGTAFPFRRVFVVARRR